MTDKNKRDFKYWFNDLKDTITGWKYFVDFQKSFENVQKYKVELNILNSLIGSKNIKEEFKHILIKYPETIKVIPILLATREKEIKILTKESNCIFRFKDKWNSLDEYLLFLDKTSLLDLISNKIINNLVDYVLGVEVGLDSNSRKNRTGKSVETIIENHILESGYIENHTYFKQTTLRKVFTSVNLNNSFNKDILEKQFDFILLDKFNNIYCIECNFYQKNGSKLNEVARSYKNLYLESKSIDGFNFIWITDGIGWKGSKKILEDVFWTIPHLYNIKDLENGILKNLSPKVNKINNKL
ncbi:type II restriction endonuclease [Mycoplasmopsis felis]|uniref:type II restriction endonuclease n=1 Tax=Mycoplasmopsis felis TaxID=33923 RepID=UPI002AFF55E4|nr:type II restriction endonuclease [Mycoplasmopsis felis]WQQ03156.1 type II restriction endonuclease [Mycoplasmopsis felis]